jgi:hypothetical protein
MAMLNKYIEFLKHFNFKKKDPQHEMSNISRKQPLDMSDLYILDCPSQKLKSWSSKPHHHVQELSLVLTFCTPNNPTMCI